MIKKLFIVSLNTIMSILQFQERRKKVEILSVDYFETIKGGMSKENKERDKIVYKLIIQHNANS